MRLRPADLPEDLLHGRAGDGVVPQVVRELVELVEDDRVGPRTPQLVALVEDLLHVGLAAGGRDDFLGHGLEPVEALLGHAGREDRDGGAGEEAGDVGAAAAVVARGGPDGLLRGGVEAAGDELREEAGEGRADLVGPGGEPLAREAHDARLGSGDGSRELDEVDAAELAARLLGLVVPVDAEEVARMHVPETDGLEVALHRLRDRGGVAHLGVGREGLCPFRGSAVCSSSLWLSFTFRSIMYLSL